MSLLMVGLTCGIALGDVDTNAVSRLFVRMGRHRHAYMVDRDFKTLSELPGMTRDGLSDEMTRQFELRDGSTNAEDRCVRRRILSLLDVYGTTNSLALIERVIERGDSEEQTEAVGSYLNLLKSDPRAIHFFASMTNFSMRVEACSRRSIYVAFANRLKAGLVGEPQRTVLATFLRAQADQEDVGAGALDEALCLCDSSYSESDVRRSRLSWLVPSGRVCPLDVARLRLELERLRNCQSGLLQ